MVNLPLSGMKTAAPGDAVPCLCAAKENAAPAAIPPANTIQAFLNFTTVLIPRVHSLSGAGFLNHQMRFVSAGSNNSTAQDFGHDLGWLAGTVHAIVGKLIR